MRKFGTYRAAAEFARRQARKTRTSARIVRDGSRWLVASRAEIEEECAAGDDGERRRRGRELMRREIDETRRRLEYLTERARHYALLSADELDALWTSRASLDVDVAELFLIWQTIRRRRDVGI